MLGSAFLEKLGLLTTDDADVESEKLRKDREATAQRLLNDAYELARAGHHSAALIQLKEALKNDSESAEVYQALGVTYLQLKEVKKAKSAFINALRIRPHYAEAHNDLGTIHDAEGNFLAAVKSYSQAIRFRSDSADYRNNLGLAYFNIGGYSEAIKIFQQTLSMYPQDARALHGLALVYIDLDDKAAAMEQQQILLESGETEIAALVLDQIQRHFWNQRYD